MLLWIQDAGAGFGAICSKRWALDLGRLTRLPHLGDYLPNCLRGCPGDCLGESLVHRLPNCLRGCRDRRLVLRPLGRLGSHGPESLVRRLPRNPVSCGAGCGLRYGPSNPPDNAANHPGDNWERNPAGDMTESRNHNSPVWGTDWRPPPGLQSN